MTIDDLARAMYAAGQRRLGNGDGGDWPYLTDRTRAYYAAMAAAVVLALADDVEEEIDCDVADARPETLGRRRTARGRLRALIAEARAGEGPPRE